MIYPPRPMHALLPDDLLLAALEQGGVALPPLRGSAAAFLLAGALIRAGRPTLWIAADQSAASTVIRELTAAFATVGGPAIPILSLPDWDSFPYRGLSPSVEVRWGRLRALEALRAHRLDGAPAPILVAEAAALCKRVVPPSDLEAWTDLLVVGGTLERDRVLPNWIERGYLSTDLVTEPGCFAVRGGTLDVFPPSSAHPVRIELWGDEIDRMRRFDPTTQRSLGPLQRLTIPPVREEILDDPSRAELADRLKALSDARGLQPRRRLTVQTELLEGRLIQELELYLPVLRPLLATVWDHLGPRGIVIHDGPHGIAGALRGTDEKLHHLWERELGRERLVPEPPALFLGEDEIHRQGPGLCRVILHDLEGPSPEGRGIPGIQTAAPNDLRAVMAQERRGTAGMLQPVAERLQRWIGEGATVAVASTSRAHRAALDEAFTRRGLAVLHSPALPRRPDPGAVHLVDVDLPRGARFTDAALYLVAEEEIWGIRRSSGAVQKHRPGEAIGSLSQLSRGDLVVHNLHGVGKYQGLVKVQLGATAYEVDLARRQRGRDPEYKPGSGGPAGAGAGSMNDYLLVEYRDGDRLYLPVHKLDALTRWVGAGGPAPQLDKLGGSTWQKKRGKVSEEIQKVAKDLLELYARRQLTHAHVISGTDPLQEEFDAAFPYETTPDQQTAIEAVLADMARGQPMDRLLCGDVGFGKTEVAMRAAFAAVAGGRQVAVLVPTTILALQHWEKFTERMAAFPVNVDMLSRFRTPSEQDRTVRAIGEGRVDIVIGTHRVLGEDVCWKDLGLLVIDEEHRFGVKHKEKVKKLKASVHVLTMTATPIPRTLHMALSGLRDFSVISTPPVGRRPVLTQVVRFSAGRIQDAIQFEIDRGGQVFFVHNRVQSIENVASMIRKLAPGVTVGVGHGQMKADDLEQLMLDFESRKLRVLVSTTIVESGIDIPTANTMIVNRADAFGLAQLHQLRGRVGRGAERGHCLLLVPPGRALRTDAVARLKAIQDHSDLGSGSQIAQQDLEIRGAGNLLGHKQSGPISDVGLATYMDLLESAVRALRGEHIEHGPEPDVDIKADAFIPEAWIPDERERLFEYKQLSDARSVSECEARLADLADRYGDPPSTVLRFTRLVEVKVLCRSLGILQVKPARGGRMELRFDASTRIDPLQLAAWVSREPRLRTLRPEGVVQISLSEQEQIDPVETALAILTEWNPMKSS